MAIAVQADGQILVGGVPFFNGISGQTRKFLARLDATTGVADSFDPKAGQFHPCNFCCASRRQDSSGRPSFKQLPLYGRTGAQLSWPGSIRQPAWLIQFDPNADGRSPCDRGAGRRENLNRRPFCVPTPLAAKTRGSGLRG